MSANQNKSNEEEVDLGSLFVIIGKGFKNFFNFIGNIFKGIFDFIITILIFLKKNSIKIGGLALIGGIIGFFIQYKTPTSYGADLLVEPNFNSVMQLYNNIEYYNDLVKQKDTLTLAKTFNINQKSAGSLKEFAMEPIINQNDIINAYNDFVLEVDTTTIKSYDFEEFKTGFTELNYKIHKISVLSKENDVFPKLGKVILSSVMDNKYFDRVKNIINENLNITDSIYRQSIGQLDSLRKVYMQVMLEESKKQTNGTNIDLGGTKNTTKELEIFNTNKRVIKDLREVAEEKSQKYEVINVISDFQPIGYEIKGITKSYAFLFAVLGAVLMISILLLIQLNKYLDNYKK